MAVVGLAIMVYFIREARDGFHWWKTFLAPILGAGAISFAFYLMMKNRAGITFGAYEGWVKYVPLISLGVFLGGCLAGDHLPDRRAEALRGRRQVRARGGLASAAPDRSTGAAERPPRVLAGGSACS